MVSSKSTWEIAAANVEPLDDAQVKERRREEWLAIYRLPKAGLFATLSTWVYLGYAFKCLWTAQAAGLSGTALKICWMSFLMQLGHAFPKSLILSLAVAALGKAKKQPMLCLTGDVCPSVDVLITTCGESLDLLMDTVRAAVRIDYPQSCFRVIVLDDSVSAEVKLEIMTLATQYPNLHYATRASRPRTHKRGGNLNHGLQYATELPDGASSIVAILDVDMIPSRHWLRATVPHLLVDQKVALVSVVQRFYNLPDGDPLGQSLRVLFDLMEPMKAAIGSTWSSGSGVIFRRDALDGIGGIPDALNDDIMTSLLLMAHGWKGVYTHQDLQWGLVPDSITAHLEQQKRLFIGCMSTATVLRNPRFQSLPLMQKFGALSAAFFLPMLVIINMANLIVLPFVLLTGAPLVAYSGEAQLRTLTVLSLISLGGNFSFDFLASRATNYHLSLLGSSSIWTGPFQFLSVFRFAFSTVTGISMPRFTPANVAAIRPQTAFGRLHKALWVDGFIIHVVILTSLALGVGTTVSTAFKVAGGEAIWKEMFVRAAWPPVSLMWSLYMLDCWVPLSFAFGLSKHTDRKRLLRHDPTTKEAILTQYARDQVRTRTLQVLPIAELLFCLGAGVYSLWVL